MADVQAAVQAAMTAVAFTGMDQVMDSHGDLGASPGSTASSPRYCRKR